MASTRKPMNNGSGSINTDVDVVVPMFNAERYIHEALVSILAQTAPPRKVIVVDDGSTDGSAAVVQQLMAKESGTTTIVLVQQPNAGLSVARNTGIAQCSSNFVAFLDADDRWEPGKLEAQLAQFSKCAPNTALVYCGYYLIDADSRTIPSPSVVVPELSGNVFHELLMANKISGSGSAVVIRRSVLEEIGGFDTALKAAEDWDMWLRAADGRPIEFVPEALVAIRRHAESMQQDTTRMLLNYTAFFVKWFDRARDRPAIMKQWGHLIAEFALRSKEPSQAAAAAFRMLDPRQRKLLFARTFGSLRVYMLLKKWRKNLGK